MLKRTFIHLPGVGPRRELAIWRKGIADWAGFLARGGEILPPSIFRRGRPLIEAGLQALEQPQGVRDLASMLPRAEHWRLYPSFDRVVFLDIETGGDPDEWGGVTVVGLHHGQEVEQYVAGHNMWLINDAMKQHDVVVTFSGSSFDLPVLRQAFPNLVIPPAHIDLRWLLRRLGHVGGLKRIERQLGLARPAQVQDLGGQDAPLLWQRHLAGDPRALPLLLEYNAQDVMNLRPLLNLAVARLKERLLGRLGPVT